MDMRTEGETEAGRLLRTSKKPIVMSRKERKGQPRNATEEVKGRYNERHITEIKILSPWLPLTGGGKGLKKSKIPRLGPA